MNYKSFFKINLFAVALCLSAVAIFNYATDPLWLFNNFATTHKNEYNERMQKTNLIINNKLGFEGIVIGSSRCASLNMDSYRGVKLFNYSMSSLAPGEYEGYIDIAKKAAGGDLKVVVMGLDFFSYINSSEIAVKPIEYYRDAVSPIYIASSLISFDALKKGKKNIDAKLNPGERYYVKGYKTVIPKREPREVREYVAKSAKAYSVGLYKKGSKKVDGYKEIFLKIKEDNPNTKFVVLTTPESMELMRTLAQNGLHGQYEEWLSDIVDVFGEVNHFMYLNPVTQNYPENFYDGHHAYTQVGDLIVLQLKSGVFDEKSGFGMKISKTNLKESLVKLRELHLGALR